jgi:3-oxoadipate enol-lactonase
MVAGDVRSLLPEIRAETLILASQNDPVLSSRQATDYYEQIPQSRLALFPDSGHLIMLNSPERFNRVVARFLIDGTVCTSPAG